MTVRSQKLFELFVRLLFARLLFVRLLWFRLSVRFLVR